MAMQWALAMRRSLSIAGAVSSASGMMLSKFICMP